MGDIYKFVPRTNKAISTGTFVKKAIKKPTIERESVPEAEKPYKLVFTKQFNSSQTKPHIVEIEFQVKDHAFRQRISNIFDTNNFEVAYCFKSEIVAGELQVNAFVELTHWHMANEKIMLSVCSNEFFEPAGKFSLVEFSTVTVEFTYERSTEAFIQAFEETVLAFIDKKYDDYLKLKARLLRRE